MVNKILKNRRKVPKFPRQDIHKKIKLFGKTWRKPKGRHGRVKRLGNYHGASPKIGRRTPKATRNLHSSGLNVIFVANLNELSKVDPKTSGVKIMSVGNKKRIAILKEALKKSIRVFNVRKPEEFIKNNEKVVKKKEEAKKWNFKKGLQLNYWK